ncbi:nucleotidyltransferase [Clostridium aminobutyricum]|uniref:tRNA(Met) cytidine acetate ligase n=1 Tax=Clostridium aminobutyricum TaxID=33953 RepID=A0A939D7N1_CLOAM|nr:nucleotidyltransferase [Clostridium aminobutyricum]MBN7772565.1 nucleotidyltransferase [Clostridium aminobutyricum]
MRVLGIIAEYNPFHNGHLYQLKESIEQTNADFVVAVMSGNFTQRGELAVLSKWSRAEMAVECGIDLVLENPFVFACNNAEYFAKGAVAILNGLGCVTHLSFGSESGDLESLKKVADFLTNEGQAYQQALKKNLDKGFSYPKARSEAVSECVGQEAAALLRDPNNILAIEYLKQLKLTNSDIIPVTVKRKGAGYHDILPIGTIASASAIRKMLEDKKTGETITEFLPIEVQEIFNTAFHKQYEGISFERIEQDYYKLMVAKILTMPETELSTIFSVREGLENKLKSAVRTAENLEVFKQTILSKRYTATRISRILVHLLIGLNREDFQDIIRNLDLYARVLGFNKKGTELLKQMKKSEKACLPCITNVNKQVYGIEQYRKLLSYDFIASDLYNLLLNQNLYDYSDYVKMPYRKL